MEGFLNSANALLEKVLGEQRNFYEAQLKEQHVLVKELQTHVKELQTQVKEQNIGSKILEERFNQLESNLEVCTGRVSKKEKFYQALLEEKLGATHEKNDAGITDLTGEDFHAEIKCWQAWKTALGQLVAYQSAKPKDRLEVYFYGKHPGPRQESVIIKAFETSGIHIHCFDQETDVLRTVCLPPCTVARAKENDVLARFVQETLEHTPDGRITTETIYSAYRLWKSQYLPTMKEYRQWDFLRKMDEKLYGAKREDRRMNDVAGRPSGFPGFQLREKAKSLV